MKDSPPSRTAVRSIHLSAVIPVFQAEACLVELHRRLSATLSAIAEDYEIILVEDRGTDHSWSIIRELACKDSHVRGLRFSRNFGQHYAITAGLDAARGDWIVVMDCDLQDQPEEIPRLYAKAREGFDVVLARRGRRADAFLKRALSRVFYEIFKFLTGLKYDEQVGNFRIISRRVVYELRGMREQLRFFGGLVSWLGFETSSVDVSHAPRFAGQSTYNYRKLFRLGLDTILAHSDRPLRLAIWLGALCSLGAFIMGVYFCIRALFFAVPVSGWSSLIVSLFFLSGVIIGMIGITGLYVGKTFDQVKGRPLFVVESRTFDHER